MEKPDVEHIEGLSPAISIEQKSTSHNPRSTVGTITEIHDYLRLLFARVGEPRCPDHGVALEAQTVTQMVDAVMARPRGERLMLLAPVVDDRKGEHARTIEGLSSQGFIRARIDGRLHELDEPIALDPRRKHSIEVVVDRIRVRDDLALRLAESFETALGLSDGRAVVAPLDGGGNDTVFSARFACRVCGYAIPELAPRIFSFNNPAGACKRCDGLGVQTFFDPARIVAHPELSLPGGAGPRLGPSQLLLLPDGPVARHALRVRYRHSVPRPSSHGARRHPERQRLRGHPLHVPHGTPGGLHPRAPVRRGCSPTWSAGTGETESSVVRDDLARYLGTRACESCGGARLNRGARNVFVGGETLPAIAALPIRSAHDLFATIRLSGARAEIASRILKEIAQRLQFLVDVGLDYLSLDRAAETLSGGEAQRIRLASQIGAGLVGVTYILDEPSIGLHQRDNRRLPRHPRAPPRPGEHRHRRRARRGGDQQRRSCHRHGPGGRGARRRHRRPGTTSLDCGQSGIPDRAVSLAAARDRGARRAHQAGSPEADPDRRRERKQPRPDRRRDPGRPDDLRHRVVRVGQVDPRQRHPVPRRGASPQQRRRPGGAVRPDRRAGDDRPGRGHRPEPDRAHATVQSRHVHRAVHSDPRPLRGDPRGALARLRTGTVQLQRAGRTMRGMQRRRGHQGRDALPPRCLCGLRRLCRKAVQPRDSRHPVQGPNDSRSAGDDGGGVAHGVRRRPHGRPQAPDAHRRGGCRTSVSGSARPRSRVARPSA